MIKAVSEKILVEFLKREMTKGGIIVPDQVQVDPQGYGKVLSVGEEVKTIKKGDFLVFHPMAGMDIVIEQKIYKVLKYEEVYGILEDEGMKEQLEPLILEKLKKSIPQGSIITPQGGGKFNA